MKVLVPSDHKELRLPVSRGTYNELRRSLSPHHLAKLTPIGDGGHLSDLMGSLINTKVTQLGSEQSTTVTMSNMLANIFRVIDSFR